MLLLISVLSSFTFHPNKIPTSNLLNHQLCNVNRAISLARRVVVRVFLILTTVHYSPFSPPTHRFRHPIRGGAQAKLVLSLTINLLLTLIKRATERTTPTSENKQTGGTHQPIRRLDCL